MNFYNENDPKAAEWLRELIKANLIAPGIVDERSIAEIKADELKDYTQCHFFAGIGGWPLAFRLAGWPDGEPGDTGSCPCQPFSGAGKQLGESDERHLWPHFREIIRVRKPPIVFGEQVASALGRQWLAGVFSDLEGMAYNRAAADLCAAGVGAPHIRQRLYWMAVSDGGDVGEEREQRSGIDGLRTEVRCDHGATGDDQRASERMGEPIQPRLEGHAGNGDNGDQSGRNGEIEAGSTPEASGARGMDLAAGGRDGQASNGGREDQSEAGRRECGIGGSSVAGRMGDADSEGRSERSERDSESETRIETPRRTNVDRSNPWDRYDIINCRDSKRRRIEPGSFPLAYGIPGRVGLLRGYGNAIVPQLAAEFILACKEALIDHFRS